MVQEGKSIVIPWDFTPVAEHALEHGLILAKQLDKEINLVHVIDKAEPAEVENKSRLGLESLAEKTYQKHGIKPVGTILRGSIFSRISEYASNESTVLVVMGTHGIKGMQKVTGSWALKVIVGSKVPFIVVQEPPKPNQYKNLIFPVDFKSENKEKLFWCIYLARYFNSKVILFKYPIADKSLLKKVNTNLNFAVRFLIQNNVQYEIQTAPSGAKFTRETLNFAGSVDADLIIINTTKHINFTDYLLGAEEQQVIANNSRIPVMCVNPRSSFSGVGQFMYGR